jgi:hypothetical protein
MIILPIDLIFKPNDLYLLKFSEAKINVLLKLLNIYRLRI